MEAAGSCPDEAFAVYVATYSRLKSRCSLGGCVGRNKNLGQRAVNAVVLLHSSMKARQELRHELREKYLRAVEDGRDVRAGV
jgi:hypothetical protein